MLIWSLCSCFPVLWPLNEACIAWHSLFLWSTVFEALSMERIHLLGTDFICNNTVGKFDNVSLTGQFFFSVLLPFFNPDAVSHVALCQAFVSSCVLRKPRLRQKSWRPIKIILIINMNLEFFHIKDIYRHKNRRGYMGRGFRERREPNTEVWGTAVLNDG